MALSVMAVSISVSPLRIEDEPVDMFITSAPRRLPASSKDDCVRVETSKNRLIWVRPRKLARFFFDLTIEIDKFFAEVEQAGNVVAGKPFDPQQMTPAEDEGGFRRDVH